MSYVAAWQDKDKIRVVERVDGKRVQQVYPADYTFYFDDPNGSYTTVYDTPVSKFSCHSKKTFQSEIRSATSQLWESDIHPINRCLETHYSGVPAPDLNVAFFDIEVDFDHERGFAPTDDPFNMITAISLYLQWSGELITLAIPPKSMSMDIAEGIGAKFDNTFMFSDEGEMLSTFLDLIDDVDVISGWNSRGFDIPYTVNRIARVLNKSDNQKWCLWGQQPKKKTYENYGAESVTYDLIGKQHLDYMQLYQKYTYHEMHSYSLDTIGDHEVQETKIAYEGTLDQLYNQDFEKFIAYNRQDTYLIHKIDLKLDFISLANTVAHENTSELQKTMGAVAVVEQGIINETHKMGLIVPNKVRPQEGDITQAAGAYVAKPKKGLHEWIGSIDINSLYPSVIRALNMAPETIIGQIRQTATTKMLLDHIAAAKKNSFASAWEGHFCSLEYQWIMDRRTDIDVTIDWEAKSGGELATLGALGGTTMSAADAYKLIFEGDMPWTMSANGTIFTYEKKGIIPGLLERWYADRKIMQKTLGRFYDLSHGFELPDGMKDIQIERGNIAVRDLDFDKLFDLFKNNDNDGVISLLSQYNLRVEGGKLIPDKDEISIAIGYWDKLQLVRKISLNSLYGALLNAHCRFFDHRLGQSTTLTGRGIAKHMDAFTNECITGSYDHIGESIIYGDTDSVYFSAYPFLKEDIDNGDIEWDCDTATGLYDAISDQCNDSFPAFMQKAYHCPSELGSIIMGGREITASKGLFITKKRYAALVIDNEGERQDVDGKPGKLKAMGLDLKRSDTPIIVQDFLKIVLMDLLCDVDRSEIFEKIKEFKTEFHKLDPWKKGTPKRVNNLTRHTTTYKETKKCRVGHALAAIHFNTLRKLNSDNYTMDISDGQKVIVCQLKKNPMGMDRIAYPIDEDKLPNWFTELPFDDLSMEDAVVNKKIDNLFGVLDWDIADFTDTRSTFSSLFG